MSCPWERGWLSLSQNCAASYRTEHTRQKFVWDDGTPQREVLAIANRILKAWGLPEMGPKPAEPRSSEPIEVWTLNDIVPLRRNPWAGQI